MPNRIIGQKFKTVYCISFVICCFLVLFCFVLFLLLLFLLLFLLCRLIKNGKPNLEHMMDPTQLEIMPNITRETL